MQSTPLHLPSLPYGQREGGGHWRNEWGMVPTEGAGDLWSPLSGLVPLPLGGGAGALRELTPPSCARSGPHRGAGPDGQDDGELAAQRLQDQEGHVPHGGAAVQRAAGEADDHAAQHHPQLCALHHPQPREEGEAARPAPWGGGGTAPSGTSSGSAAGKSKMAWGRGAEGEVDPCPNPQGTIRHDPGGMRHPGPILEADEAKRGRENIPGGFEPCSGCRGSQVTRWSIIQAPPVPGVGDTVMDKLQTLPAGFFLSF